MKIFILLGLLCGFVSALPPRFKPLIVGGQPAEQGEIPYQLGLRYYGQHHCGASLIEIQGLLLAVTAAHCTPDFVPLESLTLVAGDLSLSDSTGIEQTRKVTKIINHENFDQFTYANDIALLLIDEPFELNENVQPIALPEAGIETSGNLFVSGWGKLEDQGANPDVLQKVELPVVDHEACQTAYDGFGDEIYESFICAGFLGVGGKDACQRDSGGPARSGNYLSGIVSWGQGCADPRYPGVYTKVSFFVEWINEKIVSIKNQNKIN